MNKDSEEKKVLKKISYNQAINMIMTIIRKISETKTLLYRQQKELIGVKLLWAP